jgi:allantoicase
VSDAFLDLVDLASARVGGSVVAANDEFFAPKENLIAAGDAVWIEGRYTERGKWMDGWETRRRRDLGHDWCIVRLGMPGILRGIVVDTTHFKGNAPQACAIDLCHQRGRPTADELVRADWQEVLARAPLRPDARNAFAIQVAPRATHLRLRILPDGGVARLRAHGDVTPDWHRLSRRGQVDLAAVEHGGLVVACSDMFFGSRHNLIMPGDARDMSDGWETRRRRGEGHDWTIVRLGTLGAIERIEVDTRHFKGNAPGACSLEACVARDIVPEANARWHPILPRTPLLPDARHDLEEELLSAGHVTHVRLNIFPDGGVARLRLFGRPYRPSLSDPAVTGNDAR